MSEIGVAVRFVVLIVNGLYDNFGWWSQVGFETFRYAIEYVSYETIEHIIVPTIKAIF